MPLPLVGEGLDVAAAVSDAVVKAYGPDRPVYADPVVVGTAYPDFTNEPVFRALVSHGLALAPVPAPGRPSLLARVVGRLRGRR